MFIGMPQISFLFPNWSKISRFLRNKSSQKSVFLFHQFLSKRFVKIAIYYPKAFRTWFIITFLEPIVLNFFTKNVTYSFNAQNMKKSFRLIISLPRTSSLSKSLSSLFFSIFVDITQIHPPTLTNKCTHPHTLWLLWYCQSVLLT